MNYLQDVSQFRVQRNEVEYINTIHQLELHSRTKTGLVETNKEIIKERIV